MPRLAFTHIDEVPWREVKPQMHGERRVAVHIKPLERTPERTVLYTRYDPGLIVEPHYHHNDEVIYILEGDVTIGETHCRAGTAIILEKGTPFGPLFAGKNGTLLLEVFIGPGGLTQTDDAGYQRLLKSRGITPVAEASVT